MRFTTPYRSSFVSCFDTRVRSLRWSKEAILSLLIEHTRSLSVSYRVWRFRKWGLFSPPLQIKRRNIKYVPNSEALTNSRNFGSSISSKSSKINCLFTLIFMEHEGCIGYESIDLSTHESTRQLTDYSLYKLVKRLISPECIIIEQS